MVIVGMDEVGRGCWAGPVVVGAVLLRGTVPGVKDSKLLTRAQRDRLDTLIRARAAAIGLGWSDADEVDAVGLTSALSLAYERALAEIRMAVDEIIIDGTYNFLAKDKRARTVTDADAFVPSVSAASIIAKVARDNYMINLAKQYPGYGFEHHVGYGTPQHIAALYKLGPSPMHRKSFAPIRTLLEAVS